MKVSKRLKQGLVDLSFFTALLLDGFWWQTKGIFWISLLSLTAGYIRYRREALLNFRRSRDIRETMTLSHVKDIERTYALRQDYDTFEKRALVRPPLDGYFFHARYERVQDLLDEYAPASKRVLDLGCGFGIHTAHIANRIAPMAVGLDLNEIKLREARRIALREGATENTSFVCADAALPPFQPSSFHCILATEVLEHLINPSEGLAACNRLLSEHGILILTTPSRHNLNYSTNPLIILEKILSLVRDEVLPPYHNLHAEREFDWRKPEPHYGMHYNFTWRELERLLHENGFEVIWRGGFEMEVFPFLMVELFARGNVTQIRKVVAPIEAALERIPVIRAMGQHLLVVARKIRTL